MPASVLLLAPVAILAVVLLLGFLGCSGLPGGGPGEQGLTLQVKAIKQAGPYGVQAITNANFTVQWQPPSEGQGARPCVGPNGENLDQPVQIPATATETDPLLWQAVLNCAGGQQALYNITPGVQFDSNDPRFGDNKNNNLSTLFPNKEWAGLAATWTFYLNYHAENEVGGFDMVYKLEEAPWG
jgi:hypothetical protein